MPRHTGAEGSYPPVDLRLMQRGEDRVDDSVEFRLDVTVPESQNTVSGRSQETVAPIVILGAFEMPTSIQFDDESSAERGEVANAEADLVLAAKLEPSNLTATKAAPEKTLGRCLVMAKRACMAKHIRMEHHDMEDNMSSDTTMESIRLTPPPHKTGHLPI